jgi:hypothetical protein
MVGQLVDMKVDWLVVRLVGLLAVKTAYYLVDCWVEG